MSRDKLTTNRAGWSGKSSSDDALGAPGGYQFSRYFAVEGGVSSLGQVEATSGGRKDKFTPGAVSANLVGYRPVTDRFSVLGIIGAGWEGAGDAATWSRATRRRAFSMRGWAPPTTFRRTGACAYST